MVLSQGGFWAETPGLKGSKHSLMLQSEHLVYLSPTEYPSTAAFQEGLGLVGTCRILGQVHSCEQGELTPAAAAAP